MDIGQPFAGVAVALDYDVGAACRHTCAVVVDPSDSLASVDRSSSAALLAVVVAAAAAGSWVSFAFVAAFDLPFVVASAAAFEVAFDRPFEAAFVAPCCHASFALAVLGLDAYDSSWAIEQPLLLLAYCWPLVADFE